MTIFYTKNNGSYLDALLQIYGIVKLINKLLFFTFSYILTSKKRKLPKHANACNGRVKYSETSL